MRIFNYYPGQDKENDPELEKKIFKHSLVFPSIFLLTFWLVFVVEQVMSLSFVELGIYPLQLKGLKGIIFSPFIHSGLKHIFANSVPFFVLSLALFFFYRNLAYRIFFLIFLLSGLCVWLGGREAWHIGVSGIIYGLGSFLFFSGIFRNDIRLLTISIIVVFLYGGMFWGMFPIEPGISWESHLWGAASGFFLSFYYRKQGPQRAKYEWEDETDDEDETELINEASSHDLIKIDHENKKNTNDVEKHN